MTMTEKTSQSRIKSLFTWLMDIPGFVALGELIREWLKKRLEKFDINPRKDVVQIIRLVEREAPDEARILWNRLKMASEEAKPDFENTVVAALGDLLPRDDKTGKVIEDEAKETYKWVAHQSEEQFASLVEAMKHNPLGQIVRYLIIDKGLEGLKWMAGFLFEALGSEQSKRSFAKLEQWCHEKLCEESQKVKKSLIGMVVFPLIFIIPGAFLGGISWALKLIVVQLGIWIATFYLLRLSRKRLLDGLGIATGLELISQKTKYSFHSLIDDVRGGIGGYVRLVAAVLASEIAVGFIALWLPGHKNPLMVPLILLAAMALITHTIWQRGKLWWPKLVYRLAIFTLIASVVSIFLPQFTSEVARRARLDERLTNAAIKVMPLPGEKPPAVQQQPAVEQFSLPYSDELKKEGKEQEGISTVEAGPGTYHRLWANKPYMAVSVQMDGTKNLYNMPAGWESWTGAEPAGRLRLIAKEKGTIVKILSQR